MKAPNHDLILVGGGLANGLIALRLAQARPELRLLMLESESRPGGHHTWSFHDGDLSEAQHAWLAPLVGRRWPRHRVLFPHCERLLDGGYTSIFSRDFVRVLEEALGDRLWVDTRVARLSPNCVELEDGRVLTANAVIDGRGPADSAHLTLGHQAFLGREVRLDKPHGLEEPILMDASVPQQDGYRFVYVLPFSHDTLLIEDTHYVDRPEVDAVRLQENIDDYARGRDWRIVDTLREESGVLPITLAGDFDGFWHNAQGQPRSGLSAGLFHPTTGYSLPQAMGLAERIAELENLDSASLFQAIHAFAAREWRHQGYFRLLNRMLFLAGRPERRWQVMQRFYGLSEPLIERFYAGRLTRADKVRILMGKPPVPLGEALKAVRANSPQKISSTFFGIRS